MLRKERREKGKCVGGMNGLGRRVMDLWLIILP
jgi:hypothetical protein